MTQLPDENDTPFSLPPDVPEVMPIDYPGLDTGADQHEAYDEGRDDIVDFDPYRPDDDAVKSARRLMKAGVAGKEFYTLNHSKIRRWMEYRGGQPAHVKGIEDGLDSGGLYVKFENQEPALDIEDITWEKFFRIFKKNDLAFVFISKNPSGSLSYFYRFSDRRNVERTTQARRKT